MTMIIYMLLLLVTFSDSLDQKNTDFCEHALPYDSCSSNRGCGCLPSAVENNRSVCTYLQFSCSYLSSCADNNQMCYQPKHMCVKHSRCQNRPLCYPMNMANEEICPPLLPKTTTVAPSIPDDGICANATWNPNGTMIFGGKGAGTSLDKFDFPSHMAVDDDLNVYITDTFNHRIVKWSPGATSGELVAGGNGQGNASNQLSYPEGFVIDKQGSLLICDKINKRIQKWDRNADHGRTLVYDINCWDIAIDDDGLLYISDVSDNQRVITWPDGRIVAGGNGEGSALNQLDFAYSIFVDRDRSIFIAEGDNHRVVKWTAGATEGIIVAGGNGAGHGLNQLSQPSSVIVDRMGTVYVAEDGNPRIMRWFQGSKEGVIIVEGYHDDDPGIHIKSQCDLKFDRNGNLWVADYFNQRILLFEINKSACK